jgi:putative copper export protein/methionine-rich copper-binding protein CopC
MKRTAPALFAGVVAIAAAVALPRVLLAHVVLLSSAPAPNSNVAVAPSEIRLVFSERPERDFTHIALFAPGGGSVALDSVAAGPGNSVSARIRGALIPGEYLVVWRTVARDGHPLRGEFFFAIAPDAVGLTRPDLGAAPPAEGIPPQSAAMQIADYAPFATLLRWLTLASVVALIGAVAFRGVIVARLARGMPDDVAAAYIPPLLNNAARLGLGAAVVVFVVALLRLGLQSLALEAGTAGGVGLTRLLVATTWGHAWLVHAAGILAAIAGFVLVRRGRPGAWAVAAGGALVLTAGLAFSGHAVAVPRYVALAIAAHAVHILAAAGWLGSLLVIATVALPLSFRLQREDRWTVVADVVNVFSPAALIFAGTTVAAGVLIAWLQVPSFDALFASEYGRVLLVKLGLVGVTALIGAYNWRRVRPTLGAMPGARRLRRSAVSELGLAALVLAVTAVLVATPMPMP